MSALKGAYRAAVGLGLIAVLAGAAACGQSAPASTASTASPSSAPSSAATTTTSSAPATTEEAAGADASAVQAPVDPGDGRVDGPAVAASVFSELAKIVGRAPDNVTCPDLPGKVGAAIRCTLTDGADKYGVAVTVTSVQGTDVKFGIRVDNQPS